MNYNSDVYLQHTCMSFHLKLFNQILNHFIIFFIQRNEHVEMTNFSCTRPIPCLFEQIWISFFEVHVNEINNFCFNGRVPCMTK